MKIAIVPWDQGIKENSIFKEKFPSYLDSHILLKQEFEKRGMELNTIDVYERLEDIDFFMFFSVDLQWLNRIVGRGMEGRMIYCSGEPAVVKPVNSAEGYEKLKRIFPYIMTWNDDLVDNKRIFKRNIPYYFVKDYGNVPFSERKLLTNVSGNKTSGHKMELYSERERVVSFFESRYKDQFDLYGTGWDVKAHPSYRGEIDDKLEMYHHYKFALCLENTYGVRGYITEKIWDCLTAGIVPIYQGASDIGKFVPGECYIDYTAFSTLEELAAFLTGMTEAEYGTYLQAADRLLDSGIDKPFGSEVFCENICEIVKRGPMTGFRASASDRRAVRLRWYRESVGKTMASVRHSLKNTALALTGKKRAE